MVVAEVPQPLDDGCTLAVDIENRPVVKRTKASRIFEPFVKPDCLADRNCAKSPPLLAGIFVEACNISLELLRCIFPDVIFGLSAYPFIFDDKKSDILAFFDHASGRKVRSK